jgi:hypothetical protein
MSQRTLTIGGLKWVCVFGKGAVSIRSATTGRRIVVSYQDLTGRSIDSIERGQWKKTSDGMVTPADVRAYIEKKLLRPPS